MVLVWLSKIYKPQFGGRHTRKKQKKKKKKRKRNENKKKVGGDFFLLFCWFGISFSLPWCVTEDFNTAKVFKYMFEILL